MNAPLIHAGELTERITFQARAAGKDARGQPNGAWASVATDPTVWAKPAYITGRDIAAAGQVQATLDAKWVIRYRTDVLNTWRIVDEQGRPFDIVGKPAAVAGGREWLEITCTHGVRDGQ